MSRNCCISSKTVWAFGFITKYRTRQQIRATKKEDNTGWRFATCAQHLTSLTAATEMKAGDFKIFKQWKRAGLAEQLRILLLPTTHAKLMLMSRECCLRIKIATLPPSPNKKKKAQMALNVFPILKAPDADLASCLLVLLGQNPTYLFKNICG